MGWARVGHVLTVVLSEVEVNKYAKEMEGTVRREGGGLRMMFI